MPRKAVGLAAVDLPWLCPNTDSLIALADAPASVASLSVADPALALFLLRFAKLGSPISPITFARESLFASHLPDLAATYLNTTPAAYPAQESAIYNQIKALTARAATIACALAQATQVAAPVAAEMVTRLAPLSWFAIAAVESLEAANPLAQCNYSDNPTAVQANLWGLDHAALTRRLSFRWQLPDWVATTIGSLELPFRVAGQLASHSGLFAVVQLAVLTAERESLNLGLTFAADRAELLRFLKLDEMTFAKIARAEVELTPPQSRKSELPTNPHHVPLLPNLLRMAAECRRRNGPALVSRLEQDVDRLHRVAGELGDQSGSRLREAKLEALAELAAGAGHEINNPLAVISGKAQRLARTEADPGRGADLQIIIRQAHRISGILRDLMQFARPPQPVPHSLAVASLLNEVCQEVRVIAEEKGVLLELECGDPSLRIQTDGEQLRVAITALIRNAIEASREGGWVRVCCDASGADKQVTIAVEDNGPGMSLETVNHAFDPFFCGRTAGRGRGLGLPTAWRLIRQNGGQLIHQITSSGHTRFVFTVPRANANDTLTLRSA